MARTDVLLGRSQRKLAPFSFCESSVNNLEVRATPQLARALLKGRGDYMKERWIALLIAFACSTSIARAQTEPPPSTEVVPPRVLREVTPEYPEAQRARGEAATVDVLVTIDANGAVSDAVVAEPVGPDFDAAALRAAKELTFEPARRGGTAVASKIRYRFEFQLEPAPAAPPPPAAAPPPTAPAAAAPPPPQPEAAAADDTLAIDVAGARPPREPTVHVLSVEEIAKIPGNNGDALRAVMSMPGVARPPGGDGLLIVRGSAPRDTQVFVDGTRIPLVYHFGGLSSVIPSEMLERIDFYPGNFGPQFGRAMGGVIDVGVRSPRKDRLHGLLQFDLVDGRFLLESPINSSTRFMVAGRRSWIDAWLGSALKAAGVGVSAAPVYYDYQAMVEHDATRDTTLRLFVFGGDDRFRLQLKSPDSGDPTIGGAFGQHSRFWQVQARAETRFNQRVVLRTQVSTGNEAEELRVGDLNVDYSFFSVRGRADVRAQLSNHVTGIAGLDVNWARYDVMVRLPPIDFESNQDQGPLFGRETIEQTGRGQSFRPAAYAALEVRPVKGMKLMPGVRTDYTHDTKRWTVDPRLGVRYDLRSDFPRTTLKGGIGLFHQPPDEYESKKPFGTPGVRSNRALHSSLGIEQEITPEIELSVEGFHKRLDNLVVSQPAADSAEGGTAYKNIGSGRSYGAEVLLRYKPTGRLFGWVAYTLSRSEREAGPGQPTYVYDYDQTHNLTALASYKLGRGWQVGARFRYITGSPYTPYTGGVLDYDAGAYAPITANRINSGRHSAFHQLDLRMDKTWQFPSWALSFYVDVQNVYNRQNSEVQMYNYNYSRSKPVGFSTFLPILGLRGEL